MKPIHPAAEIFPLMNAKSLAELAADIKENGQQDWIVLWQGQVLDGRNRLRACEIAGVEPEFSEIEDDNLDPFKYVISHNLHRRHLDESQRAMVAARLTKILSPAAKERRKRKPKSVVPNLEQQNRGRTIEEAGEALNVGKSSVAAASVVIDEGSAELIAAVDSGEVAVSRAAKVAKSIPKEKQFDAAKTKADPTEKTPFDHLKHWWSKANPTQKSLFRDWIDRNE